MKNTDKGVAPFGVQVFVIIYIIVIISIPFVLWARPNPSSWPAWVQAIGSVAAILVTLWIAQWQHQRDRIKEREERVRRERAARAVVPLALTEICHWCLEVMKIWNDAAVRYQSANLEEGYLTHSFVKYKYKPVSSDAVSSIKNIIEYLDYDEACPYISLLQCLQVQQSRIAGFSNGEKSYSISRTCYDQVICVADVYARASELFDHARDKNAEFMSVPKKKYIRSALFSSKIYYREGSVVKSIVDSRYKD